MRQGDRMPRSATLALVPLLVAACSSSPAVSVETAALSSVTREHIRDDLWHYQFDIPVDKTPNGRVRVHRVVRELAPFHPRPSAHAVMLLHGDFSSFATNFEPGLAPYLAERGIDVWGADRRWTL